MFGDISNDDADHWNPMSDNPVIPETQPEPQAEIDHIENIEEGDDTFQDWSYRVGDEDEVQEVSPIVPNQKKRARVVLEVPKKQKSSTATLIQDHISKIADSASSFVSKKEGGVSIKEVMDVVLDCGADYGSNEHDIATQLFVKKDQREMFMTLPTREIRFNWLTRRYNDKYDH